MKAVNETQSTTPLLDLVNIPADLRQFDADQLAELAKELRAETIRAVSKTGGHLGAGLGVIELTLALHYVFDAPKDKIIWDVGHQTYPHKILTGRRHQMDTLRQGGGLAGFTKRKESEYDAFGAGHSSTSISAALGMAAARDLSGEHYDVIAVIGDGAMSAGMAYEAMNNAGDSNSKVVVILNDNKMSIAPAVGAMSNYLARLIASKPYQTLRSAAKQVASYLPQSFENMAKKAEQYTKDFVSGGNFFEQMGFYYIGPVNGHDLDHLVPILQNIKHDETINHPILIHVVTEKGHGYDMPEAKDEKLHAVAKFDVETGKQQKGKAVAPKYQDVFANELVKQANRDDKIVAITAAMPSGTSLDKFQAAHPKRCYDVGIAEQHAVTFAAGLACEGYKPFCAIYSTFLQRAYDQIVHDVAIQSLPVRFAIDRAGLVGADGPTHAGAFDVAFLSNLPNMVVMAASDELELARMVATSVGINDRPCAFRYPRGEGLGLEISEQVEPLEIGKGRVIEEGTQVAILSLGTRLEEVKKAAEKLKLQCNIHPTIVDARFAKPFDEALVEQLLHKHELLVTIEEGAVGGFGSLVQQFATDKNLLDSKHHIRSMVLPDVFIDHQSPEAMYHEAALDADAIVKLVAGFFKRFTQ